MRRTDLVRLGGAFVAYCAVAAGLFRALLAHPAATLPHDAGDPVLSTWILWWNAHCVPLTRAWWDGLSFYPGHGALALSDHRLGLGLIATPVQWLGGSAVLAHNAAFLLSFPLCAIAAYALTWSLTRHAGAAFVSGLVFGFSPYRVSHLEHLELLSAYWLPVALFAAHRFLDRPSPASLAVFVAAWVMQALCSSYYVLYAAPLLALWIWWFARADAGGRRSAALVAALAVGSAALIPVAAGFLNVHHALGLTRSKSEIDAFSADISSVGSASPLLAVWHSSIPATQERAIFPGAVPVGLVLAAALAGRSRRKAVARPRCVTIALGGAGLVVLAAGSPQPRARGTCTSVR